MNGAALLCFLYFPLFTLASLASQHDVHVILDRDLDLLCNRLYSVPRLLHKPSFTHCTAPTIPKVPNLSHSGMHGRLCFSPPLTCRATVSLYSVLVTVL